MDFSRRFDAISRPIQMIWLSIKLHYGALLQALRKEGVSSLLHPHRIRDAAVANLFILTSAGFTEHENSTVVPSLVASAHGKILELGPGPGNQIHRFNSSKVETIYAIDPNPYFTDVIAAKVKKNGLEGKYELLACGIEDSEILRSEGITEGSLDTVLSIQTLCAVKDAKSVMKELWKLLRPGGSFVFWEHVKNKDVVMGVTQACFNLPWSTFIGCNLNRDILTDILTAGEWENPEDIEVTNDPYDFLPRISGVLRKKD